jgi:phosphopantothenate synthetase
MNLSIRINKLENLAGIRSISIADELTRLKKLSKEGKSPPKHTVEELEKLIAGCTNDKLSKLYRNAIRAKLKAGKGKT